MGIVCKSVERVYFLPKRWVPASGHSATCILAREYYERIHMSFLPRAIDNFHLGTSANYRSRSEAMDGKMLAEILLSSPLRAIFGDESKSIYNLLTTRAPSYRMPIV